MSVNPYESPTVPAGRPSPTSPARRAAQRSVRLTLLFLLVPAAYNLVFYPSKYVGVEFPLHVLYHPVQTLALIIIGLAIWFFGLKLLESATAGIHGVLGRSSRLADWQATLFIMLRRAPFLALPGAALWGLWVFAVLGQHVNFYAASIPTAIAAHILAACLYLPLAYRWFQLERSARAGLG